MMADASRYLLHAPTVEDLEKLPRWAAVAFAARCARWVQPLYEVAFPTSADHIAAIDKAILIAEHSAATAAPAADPLFSTAAAAADPAYAAAADRGATDAARAGRAAYAAAYAAAAAAAPATAADAYAYAYADAAARAADAARRDITGSTLSGMWSDYRLLAEAVTREGWTDRTPVPPNFFGPLPLRGQPQDRLADSRTALPRLVLRAYVSEFAPEDEVVDGLVDLYKALNAYHRAAGGTGLILDDWQILQPADKPAEVL